MSDLKDNGFDEIPRQQADDLGDRIHICIGASCNNNCIFCMEDDREDRESRVSVQSAEDVHTMILANRGVREILFTSGEPTMNPDLERFVTWSAEAGYEVVGVISNGRRFSYRPYLERLLRAGLNHVIVSIHGPDAHTHDALTRTSGSFVQTLAGIVNLARMKAVYPVHLQTSTVITRRNLDKVLPLAHLLGQLDIDRHVFNVMMPDGRGKTHLDRLMPRYSEVARTFAQLIPLLSLGFVEKMALVDIPYCTTENLPDHVRGYVERYFHFEPQGSFEARAVSAGVYAQDPIEDADRLYVDVALDGEDTVFSRVTRTYQEAFVKSKRTQCATCRYNNICRGIWKPYTGRFGWDEFEPVPTGNTGQIAE